MMEDLKTKNLELSPDWDDVERSTFKDTLDFFKTQSQYHQFYAACFMFYNGNDKTYEGFKECYGMNDWRK